MRFKPVLVVGVLALIPPVVAAAQTAPAPSAPKAPAPPRVVDSAFALGAAYRAIGRAEQAGATGHYLDEARSHYRSAYDRHGRNDDAGASAEANVALDLARVALDEHPPAPYTGPKDVPAPPTPRPGSERTLTIEGTAPDFAPIMERVVRVSGPDGAFGREPTMRVMADGFGMFGRGFDATALAEVLKVEKGAEARQLAQNAVDANAAAQKAALAGNVSEALRQSRIANDLTEAVHDIAAMNHPELRGHPRIQVFRPGIEVRPLR
jgi:hypothetical protein